MQNGSSRAPTLPDTATRRTTRQWMTSLMTFDICIFSWTEQKLPYQDLLIISNHELMCNKSGNSFAVWVPPNIINIAYLYPKHIYCDIKCYYLKYYKNENIQSNLKPDYILLAVTTGLWTFSIFNDKNNQNKLYIFKSNPTFRIWINKPEYMSLSQL